MKKFTFMITFMLFSFYSNNQILANDLSGNIGISLYGGLNVPTNGKFTSTVNTTDLLKTGPDVGLGISYYFNSCFAVELDCDLGVNAYKDKFHIDGKNEILSNLNFSVNFIHNFGFLFENSIISPIAKIGFGLYNWSHLDDCLGSNIIKSGNNDLKATSFGFDIGLGADFNICKNFTVGLTFDYNMYFPKDKDKFGDSFAEQGYLAPKLKLSYNFIPECCKAK